MFLVPKPIFFLPCHGVSWKLSRTVTPTREQADIERRRTACRLTSGGSFLRRWLRSSRDPSCASGKGTESAWSSAGQSSSWAPRWCCPSPPLPSHPSQRARSRSLDPQLPAHGCRSRWDTAGLWTCSNWKPGGGTHHCRETNVGPGTPCHRWRNWIQWHRRPAAPPRAAVERKHEWSEMAGPRGLSHSPLSQCLYKGWRGDITAGFKQLAFLKHNQRWIQTASSQGLYLVYIQVYKIYIQVYILGIYKAYIQGYTLSTLLLEVQNGKYIVFPFLQRKRSNSGQLFSVNTINWNEGNLFWGFWCMKTLNPYHVKLNLFFTSLN